MTKPSLVVEKHEKEEEEEAEDEVEVILHWEDLIVQHLLLLLLHNLNRMSMAASEVVQPRRCG